MLNKSNANATSTEDLTVLEDEATKSKKNQQSGVVVVAPDGELLKIGKSIKEDIENRDKNKKDDVLYRLYDEKLNLQHILGMLMIVASVAIVAVCKSLRQMAEVDQNDIYLTAMDMDDPTK
jgi:hypothetical protein